MASESGAKRIRASFDEPDWEQLLAGARAHARSLCRTSLVDPDDLVQEALVRLLLDLDRIQDRAAWLSRVTTNLFVSELRRRRVRLVWVLAQNESPEGVSARTQDEIHLDFRRSVGRLKASDRECLGLYLAGHSHREIGARLGLPIHRIGPRLARVVKRLRGLLELP